MSHFPNPNSKTDDDEGKLRKAPLSARSDSSSSSTGSRSGAFAGLTADDLKTTEFQSEPVYRSVDLLPASLSKAADVDFGFQDFCITQKPKPVVKDFGSSSSPSAASSAIFETLPTVDRHNLEMMPKVTYTTTAATSAATAEMILNVLKTRSITFDIKRKSHSSSPTVRAQAYSPCCTRKCEFNITFYANDLGDTIVEITRYCGDCIMYRSIANELFSVVDGDAAETSEASHIPLSLCCEDEAEAISVPPPPLSKSLASHIHDSNPLFWLTTLAVATDNNLTTASSTAENAKDIMESDLFAALLQVSKTDDIEAKVIALAVLRNLVTNASEIKSYISALPNIKELLTGLLENAKNSELHIAYLSVSIVSGLLAAAPRTVGKELKILGADKVFERCRVIGSDKHFLLAEAAVEASTAFQIYSR